MANALTAAAQSPGGGGMGAGMGMGSDQGERAALAALLARTPGASEGPLPLAGGGGAREGGAAGG